MEIILKDLPIDHKLRNTPLLGFHYYSLDSKIRNEIRSAYGIASKTYNELGESWTTNDIFVYVDNLE